MFLETLLVVDGSHQMQFDLTMQWRRGVTFDYYEGLPQPYMVLLGLQCYHNKITMH